MSTGRSLNSQAIALVIGTGAAQILVAGMYVLTARSLGPKEFGPIVVAIGLGMVAAGFADLGANAYWVRELASQRLTQHELNFRMTTRFAFVAAIGVGAVFVAQILAPPYVAAGSILISTSAAQTALVPLRASQRGETVAWLIVVGRVLAIAAYFGQTALGVPPGSAIWTSLGLGDVAVAICAIAVTPSSDRPRMAFNRRINPWSGTRWYAVSALSLSAQQLDLPILAALSGGEAAGIYGAVNRWIQPMLLGIGAFTSAAAPMIAAERRVAEMRDQLLRASWILLVPIAISAAALIMAPWLVQTLLGSNFAGSTAVVRILAVAALLNVISQPLLVALQSRNYDRIAALIMTFAVAAQLIAVLIMAPGYGAIAAAVGFLVAQITALLGTVISITAVRRGRTPKGG